MGNHDCNDHYNNYNYDCWIQRFVNAHFKPFAGIGYEYNKVKPGSGQTQFGGTVQFSIPQFGDFFNDMVINTKLDSVSASSWVAGDIPAYPADIGSTNLAVGQSSVDDAINGIYKRYTYQYVRANGDAVDRTAATGANFVRYCEYPGQRLFKNVKFEVNGNPLTFVQGMKACAKSQASNCGVSGIMCA